MTILFQFCYNVIIEAVYGNNFETYKLFQQTIVTFFLDTPLCSRHYGYASRASAIVLKSLMFLRWRYNSK